MAKSGYFLQKLVKREKLRMSRRAPNNKVDVVLGAQWGDEGKGKVGAVFSIKN